jgi:hypothetical protein
MGALDSVIGKNVSLTLRVPVVFNKVAVLAVTGKCLGVLEPGLLMVDQVVSAHDVTGKEVSTDAKLAGATVGLRVTNIKVLVYDGS